MSKKTDLILVVLCIALVCAICGYMWEVECDDALQAQAETAANGYSFYTTKLVTYQAVMWYDGRVHIVSPGGWVGLKTLAPDYEHSIVYCGIFGCTLVNRNQPVKFNTARSSHAR